MEGTLIKNLYQYIKENNPEILVELEESGNTTKYLSDKVSSIDALIVQLREEGQPLYVIEESCMNILIADLKPSRYDYILQILESEFEEQYNQFIESGLLLFEISHMIKHCNTVFDDLNFSEENKDNRFLRYAIMYVIKEYLGNLVSDALQQSSKAES